MRYIKSYANDAAIQAAVDNKTLGKPYVALNDATGKIDWNGKDIDYSKMYLTIEALEDGTFYVRSTDVYYSKNYGSWITGTSISLTTGDSVRFKHISTETRQLEKCFSGNTIQFKAYGNIESLEYGDDFAGKTSVKYDSGITYCFYSCNIVDARNIILPATTLKTGCYQYMFHRCENLTTAPELPATTLTTGCYVSMFDGCKSLTRAPELPATKLLVVSYQKLFADCYSLNYVKCLATTFSAQSTTSWLQSVPQTGTFVKDANTTWSTGASGIPSGWTVIEE